MTQVTVHNGHGFTRYSLTDTRGRLLEAWTYPDGRPNAYGVDCEPYGRPTFAAASPDAARILEALETPAAGVHNS